MGFNEMDFMFLEDGLWHWALVQVGRLQAQAWSFRTPGVIRRAFYYWAVRPQRSFHFLPVRVREGALSGLDLTGILTVPSCSLRKILRDLRVDRKGPWNGFSKGQPFRCWDQGPRKIREGICESNFFGRKIYRNSHFHDFAGIYQNTCLHNYL